MAVRLSVWPMRTVAVGTEAETLMAGAAALTVTVAAALLVVSAMEIAVTVILAGEGTAVGAVYTPVESILPWVASPPGVPFTCQVTPVLVVLATAALNFCVPDTCSVALVGFTVTVTELPVLVALDLTVAHPATRPANPNNIEIAATLCRNID